MSTAEAHGSSLLRFSASVALAQNACLALFRPFGNIHGAQSLSSCLLGFIIVMLDLAMDHKAHLTVLLTDLGSKTE